MKYILFILIGLLIGISTSVSIAEVGKGRSGQVIQTRSIGGSGSTSPSRLINNTHTIVFEPQYGEQGVCIAIKDKQGDGYTYLTTLNGVATFSTNSCE